MTFAFTLHGDRAATAWRGELVCQPGTGRLGSLDDLRALGGWDGRVALEVRPEPLRRASPRRGLHVVLPGLHYVRGLSAFLAKRSHCHDSITSYLCLRSDSRDVGSPLGLRTTGRPPDGQQRETATEPGAGRDAADSGIAGLHLLTNSQVQKDLHLTDEQRVQILTLSMEVRENRGMIGQRLAEILTPAQLRRLKQICLQVEGPAGLNTPDMIKALNLSPEQCAKLKALQDQVREKVQELVDETKGLSTEERRAKMPEILAKLDQMRKDITEQAIEVLTPQQREKFEKMQGVKLNLDVPRPRPEAAAKELPAKGDKSQ